MDNNMIFMLSAAGSFIIIFSVLYLTKPESMTRMRNGEKRVCIFRIFLVSLILSLILSSGIYVYNIRNKGYNFAY